MTTETQAPDPAPRPFTAVKTFADSVLAMLDERIKTVDQAAHPFNDYFGDQPETIVAAKAQAGELREVRTQVRILGDRALVDLMKFKPAIPAPEGAPGDMVLVPRELIKDAAESVDDYRCSLEFGAHDRKLLGRLKAALAAPAPQAPTTPEGEPLGAHLLRLARKHDLSSDFQAAIRQAAELLTVPSPAEGDAASEPYDSRGPTTLEGWRSAALDGEKERDWLRERLRLITRHQEKDCWYWQNDGEDHLESMTNALPVVIRADHLRALLADVQPSAVDGDFDSIIYKCRTATAVEARAYLRTALAALTSNVQPKGMPAEWLDAFEEWRQTLGAADLDGKRDLVWRHIAGTGFQAGAAWARSQAPTPAAGKIEADHDRARMLEVIALGESQDPVKDANDALVATGWWTHPAASPAPAHDRKAQALALCHALEEQPGSQYQTAAVLAAFKVYRAFESIEKHGEIRQWVFDVAAPCAAVKAEVPADMVLVPREPTPGLLMSMALRYDHGLGMPGYYDDIQQMLPEGHPEKGITHARRLESTLTTMRQLHEEVVGAGFYKPEREASYAAMGEAKPPVQHKEQQ